LQPFVDQGTLAGAVTLVADGDRVLSLNAVGYADIAAKGPMRADTLFWIASRSKPITATARMLLVDEGKANLDDAVARHLPEFKNPWLVAEQDKDHLLLKKPKGVVTIRHLLRHTSGLPFRSAMAQPTLDLLRLRDAVRSYARTPPRFAPGARYQHSDAGINTAGLGGCSRSRIAPEDRAQPGPHCCGGAASRITAPRSSASTSTAKRPTGARSGVLTVA
jgi:CubicO group peptidase (beta-lactamase class C family)